MSQVNSSKKHSSSERIESPLTALDRGLVGRELDAAIAERVMKWRFVRRGQPPSRVRWYATNEGAEVAIGESTVIRCWSPSSNITDAMDVFEHFHEQHRMISVNGSGDTDGYWCVIYPLHDGPITESDTYLSAAEAICRAALAAIEVNASA